MADHHRSENGDRRAHSRGGRRDSDQKKPWYMRRRLWLAAASVMFMGWRKVKGRVAPDSRHTNIAA